MTGKRTLSVDNISFLSFTAIKKSDLLNELQLQARDIRFSALTTLLVRKARIILRLQVM